MAAIKDDWEKPRSKNNWLTADEIAKIRVAFKCGRTPRDIARELKCSTRIASKYYAQFRGKPEPGRMPKSRPEYREIIHAPQPAPVSAVRGSRFYKSNFEL